MEIDDLVNTIEGLTEELAVEIVGQGRGPGRGAGRRDARGARGPGPSSRRRRPPGVAGTTMPTPWPPAESRRPRRELTSPSRSGEPEAEARPEMGPSSPTRRRSRRADERAPRPGDGRRGGPLERRPRGDLGPQRRRPERDGADRDRGGRGRPRPAYSEHEIVANEAGDGPEFPAATPHGALPGRTRPGSVIRKCTNHEARQRAIPRRPAASCAAASCLIRPTRGSAGGRPPETGLGTIGRASSQYRSGRPGQPGR